ncbi:Kinase, NEK [Giardia duodenalis]|uniref:non-specific serine/threonine protein kinase n=1 Tax=Giardia intestinalis (strain ATCC 50803 / WB clone C6) TaxID=184922 RepID=A8BZ25_GIAIC|nr:Kinase, NEK [Giardia intestinalis]KAE8301685.1 Kinase, NEK [Giardia intestinalis]|eukprot:XP_001704070.1 Kinase, NEK [Giardia lamblia ATCC 50803]
MATKVDAKMRANLHRLIGHGAFGAVYSLKNNNKDVIKVIDLVKLTDDVLAILQSEISILPKMKHRNIIEYKQIVRGERYLYIRMTYYPETLRDIITSHTSSGKCLSDTQILDIAQQLSEALAYLHSPTKRDSDGRLLPPIIHRDIKPENILVSKDRTAYVLADFGLCRVLERNQYANTTAGTPFYTAPEIRQKRKYDTKADMWSLGAVLYELATGERPNLPLQWRQTDAAMHWKRVFSRLRNDYIRAIISHLLISDQDDRSTAAELLQLLKEFEGSILLCQQSTSSHSSTSSLGATNTAESPSLPISSTASHQDEQDNVIIETRTTETNSNNLTEVYKRIDRLSERHHSMTGQLLQLVELCQELRAENKELRTQLSQLGMDIKRVISEIIPIETRINELARENGTIKNRLSDQEIKLHELDIAVKILEDTCDELRPPSARFRGTDSLSGLESQSSENSLPELVK